MTLWSLNAYSLFMLNFVHNMCKTRLYNILDSLKKHFVGFCILTACAALLSGCSAERFLADDDFILANVKMESNNRHLPLSNYRSYIQQEPNSRWFNLSKIPLGIYCLQSRDTTRRWSRFIRRLGEAPVIYDSSMTKQSCEALSAALRGHGFLRSSVCTDTIRRKRQISLVYRLNPGLQSYVENLHYESDSPQILQIVRTDLNSSLLYKGMPLDEEVLSAERSRIIATLREKGYYNLHKEFITFSADTASNDYGVDLTLHLRMPAGIDSTKAYAPYRLKDINIYEEATDNSRMASATLRKGMTLHFPQRSHLKPRVYNTHTYLRPDSLYREKDLRNSYSALNSLPAINYSTIRFTEPHKDSALLNADIFIKTAKPHTISAELEGTNTSGNLGAAVVLSYTNRNIFKGSESLSVKLRGAYEAITGLEGYSNQNYLEMNAETALRFPTLLMPFVSGQTKQHLKSTSEVTLMYGSQNRPEFHRRLLTGTWTYRWSPNSAPQWQHRLDLLSLNYIFMPWISDTFRQEYLEGDDPHYAVLRNSYENLFIMKTGYNFTYNSVKSNVADGLYQTNGYQIRIGVEFAGNLLYGLSHLFNAQRDKNNNYTLFNIAYSQYAKFDLDYAKSFIINDRNSMALHLGLGIAIPYGNSTIIPYEKRYFSGGANSVRGWNVRQLGPGSYKGKDGKIDFINQTGNLKLDMSLEYRTYLFWKLHAAAFIDAGNIWNTRNYADQPGGQFRFDSFYRQIAVSYGLGLRLNFDFFILRFDGGMKAIDPSEKSGRRHYPVIHPKFKRDFTFHFAVGLPF